MIKNPVIKKYQKNQGSADRVQNTHFTKVPYAETKPIRSCKHAAHPLLKERVSVYTDATIRCKAITV